MKPIGHNDFAHINGQHELSVGPAQPTTNLQLKSHMKSKGKKKTYQIIWQKQNWHMKSMSKQPEIHLQKNEVALEINRQQINDQKAKQ